MNQHSCEKERDLLGAQRTGVWTDALRLHLESCQLCQDTLLVDHFLDREALTDRSASLPTARQVWWRAERRRRREAAQRALWPIRIWERLSWLAGAVGAVFSLVLFAPVIRDWLASLAPALPSVSASSTPVTTVALLFAGSAVTAVLMLRGLGWLWAEE